QVFSDFASVWMEIQVGAETLAPRVQVQAEPYALNASNLEGRSAAGFLDTSATGQTKAGHLTVNNGIDVAGSSIGISATGGQSGGSFAAGNTFAYVADTSVINTGIHAQGNDAGGWFKCFNTEALIAHGVSGIDVSGATVGGRFFDIGSD